MEESAYQTDETAGLRRFSTVVVVSSPGPNIETTCPVMTAIRLKNWHKTHRVADVKRTPNTRVNYTNLSTANCSRVRIRRHQHHDASPCPSPVSSTRTDVQVRFDHAVAA